MNLVAHSLLLFAPDTLLACFFSPSPISSFPACRGKGAKVLRKRISFTRIQHYIEKARLYQFHLNGCLGLLVRRLIVLRIDTKGVGMCQNSIMASETRPNPALATTSHSQPRHELRQRDIGVNYRQPTQSSI
jgi:hypothetical protein